ncbi:YrhB domain-containing protein [Bradyrhizobium sp. dw_411]|uniref:YrhB domain-containing protein n=1 Tax=Bradyrhizobium sp. dw_411 TaxID=2720082 RepID=UPI001BCA9F81|nr:YrhB domain-containing protein [Bradyrhizobium sp. dw_411]
MFSFDQAKTLAEEAVAALAAANEAEFVLIHEATVEIKEGWIFFYNSREFVETGAFSASLLGNGPIFIDRGGVLRWLPTAGPWQEAIRDKWWSSS